MKEFALLFFLIIPYFVSAQIYTDASANLPSNGAKGTSMDVRAADLDGDGDLDIVLANEFQANTILINDGNAVFSNGTQGNLPQVIHDSEDVAIADFNMDGHLDFVFCSEDDVVLGGQNVHEYYFGDGGGGFVSTNTNLPDSEANAVIEAEINGDDFPDLFFGNNGGTGVLINNGDGTFSEENNRVPPLNKTTQDLALADVDGDGDFDLFEGNEDGNVLHINDGTGNYTDETATRLPGGSNIETRKVSFGDVDADKDMDIFLSNVEFITGKNRQNRLLLNDGNGFFTDASSTNLPADNDHTIDAVFEDVDLDGDLDIIVANVFGAPVKAYLNDGAGVFFIGTQEVFGQNYIRDALGVIAEDFNGDGYKDIYICDRFQNSTNKKDLLLLREIPSSSNNRKDEIEKYLMYPNPASSHFFIESKDKIPEHVSLFDSTGRFVKMLLVEKVAENLGRINLLDYSILSGLYFVEIEGWKGQIIIKND